MMSVGVKELPYLRLPIDRLTWPLRIPPHCGSSGVLRTSRTYLPALYMLHYTLYAATTAITLLTLHYSSQMLPKMGLRNDQ